MPAGAMPSVTASQSIASSAKSGVESSGSAYTLSSGVSAPFSVGGSGAMNNQLLILGGVALVGFFLWTKFKK